MEETEVKRLMNALLLGIKVNRVYAWAHLRIADLRSRISDCERQFNVTIDRQTVKGKRYREYWINKPELK
jgi:hypothetical protein